MKTPLRLLISSLLLGLAFQPLSAQLQVQPLLNPGTISTLLAGNGLSISNVVVNCDTAAVGTFIGTASNIGVSGGLVLSTGNIQQLGGPNNYGSSGSPLGAMGDSDMDLLTGGTTYDACVLEFDCVPTGDTLLFNFVFGSEEYPEFVNTGFNDGFAIYLTGPGFASPTNVAFLTGSSTVVTVNNVNAGTNSGFFVDNGDGTTAPQNADTTVVQLDGFTTNLTSVVPVMPGGNYHFKIAVADAGDGIFDTAVFLQAASFRTAGGAVANDKPKPTGLRVFPNPSNGSFHVIPSTRSTGPVEWTLYDMGGNVAAQSGKIAMCTLCIDFKIDLPILEPGIYNLVLHQGAEYVCSKVVIE